MNRPGGWILASLFILILTLAAISRAGILSNSPPDITVRRGKASDLFDSANGWRYRRAQPAHWIYMVLQR